MAAPAHSLVQTASTVQWSDGANFQGYVLFLLALPTFDGSAYTKAYLKGDNQQQVRIPIRLKWPIVDGALNSDLRIWRNASIAPPNSKWYDVWYDETRNQVATGSGLITISADPYTLTVPTLTATVATATTPTPEDQAIPSTTLLTNIAPTVLAASGTGSSVTITSNPVVLLGVFFNGQKLRSGTDFNIVGTTITFTSIVVGSSDYVEVLAYV